MTVEIVLRRPTVGSAKEAGLEARLREIVGSECEPFRWSPCKLRICPLGTGPAMTIDSQSRIIQGIVAGIGFIGGGAI